MAVLLLAGASLSAGCNETTTPIEVPPVDAPARVEISYSSSLLRVGDSLVATAVLFGATGDTIRNMPVHWTLADTSVATVRTSTATGTTHPTRVLLRRAGQLQLSVSYGNMSMVSDGTVMSRDAAVLRPVTTDLLTGTKRQFRVNVYQNFANVTRRLQWSSSQPQVASVDSGGVVTALAPGSATIAMDFGEGKLMASVSVTDGPRLRFVDVAAGDHSCGITSEGRAYCWGRNHGGSLGTSEALETCQSKAIPIVTRDGTTPYWNYHDCAITPVPVDAPEPFSAIFVTSGDDSCGLGRSGAAYCWGGATWNPLPGPPRAPGPTPGRLGTSATTFLTLDPPCVITAAHEGFCAGQNFYGERGTGDTVRHIPDVAGERVAGGIQWQQITGGFAVWHRCGLSTDGVAWCWGTDAAGSLGQRYDPAGTAPKAIVPTPVRVKTAFRFTALSVNRDHSCGLTADGTVRCWGRGIVGGTDDEVSVPVAPVRFRTLLSNSHCGIGTDGQYYCISATSAALMTPPGFPVRAVSSSAEENAAYAMTCIIGLDGITSCWSPVGYTYDYYGTGRPDEFVPSGTRRVIPGQ